MENKEEVKISDRKLTDLNDDEKKELKEVQGGLGQSKIYCEFRENGEYPTCPVPTEKRQFFCFFCQKNNN